MTHKFRTLFLLFLFLLQVIPLMILSQDVKLIDLGGKWKLRQAGTTEWKDAFVPGCVHLDLLRDKLIPDPFYGDNESKLQWIGETGWEYKKEFMISDTLFKVHHVELDCKGLDTYANVYINDSLVIVADNMFREWFADIKRFLRPGENTIRIRFPSIVEENKSRYSKYTYRLPGDDKVVCRKAAYHFGWDWGPTYITSGIWRPIYIRTWDWLNLLGVQYITNSITDSAADLTAVFTILSSVPDTCDIRIRYQGKTLARMPEVLNKGVTIVKVNFTIDHPQRWWPNGMGGQYLYPISHEISFAGKLRASGTTKIGLRTIELVQQKDPAGFSFYFKVNGVPVFMKGANYIPQDNFLPRVTDSAYRSLIRTAAESHMNMLRVWGGGIYENDVFYNLCDEYGILVWQDFMFACAMYPTYKDFIQNVNAEAIQNVVRLRNHPCIALWCGNNEIDEGWKNWGWQKQYGYSPKDSTTLWMNYLSLFENLLKGIVRKYDSLTPYISTSPRNGWGRPESLKEGDMHYWGIWWGREPFSNYNIKVGRFMSEYGFQGFPSLTTIKKFTPPEDRKLGSAVMKAHQKHPAGYELIEEYLQRDFRKPKDFESYDYVSQLVQAEGIKTAVEAHRRARPYCMGTLYWQLNDCWPVVSWSSQDYYGEPKALQYVIKKDYQAFLVSAFADSSVIKVYVVSDSLANVPAKLKLSLISFDGRTIWESARDLVIPANSSTRFYEADIHDLLHGSDPGDAVLVAELSSGTRILASNSLYFRAPKDLSLPVPGITKNITEIPGGFSIELKTDKLAKSVFLSATLPGKFSDNYFDMMPGETRTIVFLSKSRSADFLPQLKIKTLIDSY